MCPKIRCDGESEKFCKIFLGTKQDQRVSRAFAGRVGHAGTCMGVEEHDDSPGRRLGEKHDGRTRTCGQSRASTRTS
jgi:hypothetical protein